MTKKATLIEWAGHAGVSRGDAEAMTVPQLEKVVGKALAKDDSESCGYSFREGVANNLKAIAQVIKGQ